MKAGRSPARLGKAAIGIVALALGASMAAREVGAQSMPIRELEPLFELAGPPDDPLSLPSDVAVDERRVYVVDSGNHRVVVFDQQGQRLFAFAGPGSGPGQLQDPVGIGTGPGHKVYVADTGNRRIQVFDADGGHVASFPTTSADQPIRPIDVAVHPTTLELFVTGNDNHKVLVYSGDGQLLREWGGNGSNRGQFRYPATITVAPDGRVAVVDVLNTRVQVFETSGTFSAQIGGWGVLPGQLFRPKGVALDRAGRYFVSDSYLNVVQVFSDLGQFQHVVKSLGQRPPLRTPVGLAVDARSRLYVVEMLEHKVSVFQYRP